MHIGFSYKNLHNISILPHRAILLDNRTHRLLNTRDPTLILSRLFPISLLVLLMTHSEIHQTVPSRNNTDHGGAYHGGAEGGFKDRLENGM
jgi:hypothetical protein